MRLPADSVAVWDDRSGAPIRRYPKSKASVPMSQQ